MLLLECDRDTRNRRIGVRHLWGRHQHGRDNPDRQARRDRGAETRHEPAIPLAARSLLRCPYEGLVVISCTGFRHRVIL